MATSYGNLTAEQRTYYEMTLLPRAVAGFPHLWAGQAGVHPVTKVPENQGATVSWRRLNSLAAATTPLTENVNPDATDFSVTAVTGTVQEYGAYVRITKMLADMGVDRVAAELVDALGEQAGDTLDQLVRDTIVAGSTVQYASTATSRSTITHAMVMSASEILEALATLQANKAAPVIDGMYLGIVHPYTVYDMFKDTTIQAMLNYAYDRGSRNPWVTGYIGDCLGVRWYVSPNAKVFVDAGSSNEDVYTTLIIGKSAFGIGGLGAYLPSAVPTPSTDPKVQNTAKRIRPLRIIDKDFGSAGTSDPLNRFATMGWYTTFVTARLVETFMVRIEHACSLGS